MGNRIGKGKGNDATQDVSLSQFVPPKPPPSLTKPPTISRGSQKNDMSLWGGVVVGTSDFAPAPTKKVRSNTWKWIAGAGALAGIAIAAVFFLKGGNDAATPTAVALEKPAAVAAEKPAAVAAEKPAEKSSEAPAASGGSGSATGSAADVAAGSAAAPTVAALTSNADAVSGVAPVIKPKPAAKKKAPARKKTAKATLKKKVVPKKKK